MGHTAKVGKLFALLTHSDRTVGIDTDHAVLPNQIQLLLQIGLAVRYWVQIGHGAHCGVATPGCCQRTGENGLFVRKTRLSEMHMHITKAGNNSIF